MACIVRCMFLERERGIAVIPEDSNVHLLVFNIVKVSAEMEGFQFAILLQFGQQAGNFIIQL